MKEMQKKLENLKYLRSLTIDGDELKIINKKIKFLERKLGL